MTGDMTEITLPEVLGEQKQLDLISLDHPARKIIARGRHKRIRHKRMRRDKSVRWLIRVAAASLVLNMVQSVIIYILQAGPI